VFGQFLDDVVFAEDELADDEGVDDFDEDDVDDFAAGELEAAWAIAVPPPTSGPEIARAIRALVSRCRMVRNSLEGANWLRISGRDSTGATVAADSRDLSRAPGTPGGIAGALGPGWNRPLRLCPVHAEGLTRAAQLSKV
jgi:hypothetical protein